jgi:ubiquinol-cytochrome c reductase cytochrome c1 subunit
MNLLSYRDLSEIGLSEEQVKAIAASKQIGGDTDDSGQPIERAGLPSDHFKAPFANEKAARAANGGALPPDQSLLVNAREGTSDYVNALLQGYEDPPKGVTLQPGQYYNKYMAGHMIAMPPPLADGAVDYADGTKATLAQEAHDVTAFLTWAANPEMEARKRMGVKAVLFLALMSGLTYAVKKKVWKDVH